MGPVGLPDLTLSVSTFAHALDVAPRLHRLALPDLIRALTTFRVRPGLVDKRMLPAWSPAQFVEGTPRRSDAVVGLSCLVLDLDDVDVHTVCSDWAVHLHVLHTTWSHRPETPRWRLVLPLARPVPASRWEAAWRWAAERTPADRACRDPGRLYFLPAIQDVDQPHEARVQAGPLLDLLAVASEPDRQLVRAPRRRICVPRRLRDAAVRRRIARDPATRERIALSVGGLLAGIGEQRRAEDVPCPACGRTSVWFWLAPRSASFARCQHRDSCGWTGPLGALLTGGAA